MGVPLAALRLLLEQHAVEPLRGPALTLGVLDVSGDRDQVLAELIRASVGVEGQALSAFTRDGLPPPTLGDVLALLGVEGCQSLDKFGGEGASVIADLNQPLPAALRGRFALVVDGGTLEHVFDVKQALSNVIAALKPGGRVVHVSPVAGWENHGFFSLSPKLFRRAYRANGFEDCSAHLIHLARDSQASSVEPCLGEAEFVCDTLRYRSLLLFCATKRRELAEFVLPVDTHQEQGAPAAAPPPLAPALAAPVTIARDAILHERGHCYTVELPSEVTRGQLLEDGAPLSARDRAHAEIRASGGGQHSFWVSTRTTLYFSTSDNSDPRRNGRRYSYRPLPPEPELESDALAWREDEDFHAFYREAQAHCGLGPADRHYVLRELLVSVGEVPGDTAECGVFQGLGSAVICHYGAEAERAHHCFDSFEGLSEPTAEDRTDEGVRPWKAGMMQAGLAKVQANLAQYPRVAYHAGWIPDCFAEAEGLRFAFVHIDVDLYAPTRDAVEFFYPRLSPGGILVCDDYGFLTCPGAQRALDEVLAGRPERLIRLPTGQAYFVKAADA